MTVFLGIDIGTSGTKALLMESGGAVLATATASHDVSTPKALWSEQAPEDWWNSTVQASREALRAGGVPTTDVKGIGLSGQMHGLVLLDAEGAVLRPAIIWNDQRTGEQAWQIEEALGGREQLVRLAGNAAMTSFTLTKLLWVRQHEPRIYDRVRHMLLPKDYIRYRLTGEIVGDVSDMSGTLLLDPSRRDWSKDMCSRFEIDTSILPPVVESHEVAGKVTTRAADEMGLPAGTPVVAGGGDQPVGAVGCGVVREGLTSATLGTSGVVYVHSPQYNPDPQSRVNTFCSCVAGEYCMFGCVLSAGGSFQWFRNTLGSEARREADQKGVDVYEILTAEAAQAKPGCEGLFFLPYLTGERTPHADPQARGGWVGLTPRIGRAELVRSVMEGVSFAMGDILSLLRRQGQDIRQVRLAGGGARSELWRQMQADIYGCDCAALDVEEGPALGAALLAAVGCGEYDSVPEACEEAVRVRQVIEPQPEVRKQYTRLHEQFDRLYPALRDEFARIAELD